MSIQVKIRKRKGEKPLRTYLESSLTVAAANASIRADLELPAEAFLSLNGKDPLGGTPSYLHSAGALNRAIGVGRRR